MADQVQVTGPVHLADNSKERVAYELMIRISNSDDTKPKDEKYWLTLYRKCWKATQGWSLVDSLKAD